MMAAQMQNDDFAQKSITVHLCVGTRTVRCGAHLTMTMQLTFMTSAAPLTFETRLEGTEFLLM